MESKKELFADLIFWYIVNRWDCTLEINEEIITISVKIIVKKAGTEVLIDSKSFDADFEDHFSGFCTNSFTYSIDGEEVIRDTFYQRVASLMIR